MYNDNNPFYIEMTPDSSSYRQLRLEETSDDKDQIQLLRIFDLPADEFITPEEVTVSLAHPIYKPDSAPITITTNVPALHTKVDNIVIELEFKYVLLAYGVTVTLISPAGTSVETYSLPGDFGDWAGDTASHSMSTKLTHPGENWEGEWKIILAFAVVVSNYIEVTKADYIAICPTLELTAEEARTIYTLPNADSSGSSMYSVDSVNKKVIFSKTSLLWLDGVHHSRGYNIELPAISNADTITLLRKTASADLTKEWLITEAIGSGDMRKSLNQILFLDTEHLTRADIPKLNPFTTGVRNGYSPLAIDSNSDNVILQKFFPDSIGVEQYVSFYPSYNSGIYTEDQVCSVTGALIDGPLDFCHLPADLNPSWGQIIKMFNVTWDPLDENGSDAELHIYIEHPDVRELKIRIEGTDGLLHTLKDYGVSNEVGGIVNLDTIFGARSHTFGGGTAIMNSLGYPNHSEGGAAHSMILKIDNNGGQDGVLMSAEIRCFTGINLAKPVTWIGQITGERLEEFGDSIDVVPRARYQFEFRTVAGGFTNKWLPSIPFGHSALGRSGGELVKWRQADPDSNIIDGWHTIGMKLGHLSNVQAKRKVYD